MKLLKSLTIVFSFGLMAVGLRAQEPAARFDFVRPLGMGGAFTAVADDQNIFNFNPAGMVQRTGGQLTLLEIGVGIANDTRDAIDFISDNESDLTNWENLSAARQAQLTNEIANNIAPLNPRVNAAFDVASYVSGPTFLGMPVHVGFGAFGTIDSTFRLNNGILIPNISFEVNNDIVLPIAVAKRFDAPWIIPGKIGFGVQPKLIQRRQVKRDRLSILELEDIDSPPVAEGDGYGMDVGVLHQVSDRLTTGLMVQDFLGTNLSFDAVDTEKGFPGQIARDTVIAPRTNVGVAYIPKKILWLLPTTDRWIVSADVRDILNDDDHILFQNGLNKIFGEDFYTHFHLGLEYRWWIVRLRGGANKGYPTFGFGLDIPFLKIDYAFYSEELGAKAGDLRQKNHMASIAFRFGGDKVEARERVKKAKDVKKQKKMGTPEPEPAAATSEPVQTEPPAGDELPQ